MAQRLGPHTSSRAIQATRTTPTQRRARHPSCTAKRAPELAADLAFASAPRIVHHSLVTMASCALCGRPLDEHNRHLRFHLPEPVLDVPRPEREARTWGNDVLMQVLGVGAFVRVLVPIHLTGGYTVTFGAWLGVDPDDLRKAYGVWHTDDYRDLELDGRLANMLPPWESHTLARPLRAIVRDPDVVPYAAESSDDFLQRVLTDEWPHEEILAAVAPYEDASPPNCVSRNCLRDRCNCSDRETAN
jgi:hypothetical protein